MFGENLVIRVKGKRIYEEPIRLILWGDHMDNSRRL